MSASYRTGRMTAMGIHDAPPNFSEEAFEAKWKTLVDSIMALPVAQRNFISFDAVHIPNHLATEHLKALGFKPARPTVWIALETQITSDPGFARLIGDAEEFGWRSYAISFVADVLTKVDVPFPTGGDHGHLMGVFKPPANLSAEEFVNKTQGLVSRFFALPIAQKLVNYSLWTQNDTNAANRKGLGLPAPDPVLMVMLETELVTDPAIKSLAEEFLREFGDIDYEVFSADIVLNAKKPEA
ncbi:hypothetical protein B0H13DRAFT_2046304 [Mycena leptocephala]|nr:hypothetical protein B0H13DRAFT_2046304 [Mycena leptocephala]